MDAGTIGFWFAVGISMQLSLAAAVHDHMYSRGERKTTFFKWTGTNYSPLLNMAGSIRKSEAKAKGRR